MHLFVRGAATPTLVPPRPFQRGVRRTSHPDSERRDARTHRADRSPRPGLVPQHRRPRGSRIRAGHGDRRTAPPRSVRGRARRSDPRSASARGRRDQATSTALLVGGYFGTWLSAAEAATQRLDQPSLSAAGHAMGAGVIVAIGTGRCGLAETAHVIRYLADDERRAVRAMCPRTRRHRKSDYAPCRGGSWGGSRAPRSLERTDPGRGACRHPDGAVRLLLSTSRVRRRPRHHVHRGPCTTAFDAAVLPVTPPVAPRGEPTVSQRLRVNPIQCHACGQCAELFPEWITLDGWGYPIIGAAAIPPGLPTTLREPWPTVQNSPANRTHRRIAGRVAATSRAPLLVAWTLTVRIRTAPTSLCIRRCCFSGRFWAALCSTASRRCLASLAGRAGWEYRSWPRGWSPPAGLRARCAGPGPRSIRAGRPRRSSRTGRSGTAVTPGISDSAWSTPACRCSRTAAGRSCCFPPLWRRSTAA